MDVNEELNFFLKIQICWGVGWGVGLRGVRLDVNEELKFLCKIQKKYIYILFIFLFFFWGGGRVGGSGWWEQGGCE